MYLNHFLWKSYDGLWLWVQLAPTRQFVSAESLKISREPTKSWKERSAIYLEAWLKFENANMAVVQSIDQSVKDFFLDEGLQLPESTSVSNTTSYSHFQLAKPCLKYISLEEIRMRDFGGYSKRVITDLPYLRYCAHSWISLLQGAEHGNAPQNELFPFLIGPNTILQQ